ncbi:MAG: PTS-dependent dihydroxyacetone kinase phosphotransferase subunit DhaM [Clostridiaceae bacterium]|nr:PTS-dependent dihydroxyacetone kinase phosphotransferase subunit DhaM [Clostridiaceae bacterium]
MVGFVIVSHSQKLAESVVELTGAMAPGAKIAAAGGLEDGSFGTSFDRISNAVNEVYSDDGVIVLMDMGSAVMTTEMVLESMPERKIKMADCPLVEGAIIGTISAISGRSLEAVLKDLSEVKNMVKIPN